MSGAMSNPDSFCNSYASRAVSVWIAICGYTKQSLNTDEIMLICAERLLPWMCFAFVYFFFIDYESLKLLTTVTQHHSWVQDSTRKSKANFIACIDKYVNSTLPTPLTHDILCMQSFWEKDFTKKPCKGFKKTWGIF